VFGSKPPPAPPTDAAAPYPPGAMGASPMPEILQGFSYAAHDVQWFGQRLKFAFERGQAFDSWCRLQKSYQLHDPGRGIPDAPDTYDCVPGWSYINGPDDAGAPACKAYLTPGDFYAETNGIPVACDLITMCKFNPNYCQCDSCGCAGSINATDSFDITFDGDVVTGIGSPAPYGGLGTPLRLTRAAP
jgi:hypothetical protein